MWMERLPRWLQAARGEVPAELVLTGGRVANVYTGEWQETDVALFDGIIVGLGNYPGPRLDVAGRYLAAGFHRWPPPCGEQHAYSPGVGPSPLTSGDDHRGGRPP